MSWDRGVFFLFLKTFMCGYTLTYFDLSILDLIQNIFFAVYYGLMLSHAHNLHKDY